MDPRRVAAAAAALGGLGWLAEVALVWASGEGAEAGLAGVMHLVGLVGLFVALAAAGYTLVATAPVWLRAVVGLAMPLLVLMVAVLANQAILAVYPGDSWLREEAGVLAAGVLAVVLGLWGFRRRPGERVAEQDPPARGRRAAR